MKLYIIDKIIKRSNSKNIILGIAFILVINILVFPYFFTSTVNLDTILDVRFGFSKEEIISIFTNMGESGRSRYLRSTLFIDTPYALIYGFIYSFIIIALWKNTSNKSAHFVFGFPLFISIFDLIENSGIIYFINTFPNINPRLVTIMSISNQLKWICALITIGLIFYLLLKKFHPLIRFNNK